MRGLDPSNMAAMQEAMTRAGCSTSSTPPPSRPRSTRLETTLALVEGWVDEVVGQATEKAMPQAGALREAVRRRRASGGPAEATFATLVGLELRPRRLRDAVGAVRRTAGGGGRGARDAVWAHPESLPTAADLDDPLAFAQRTRAADDVDISSPEFDAALAALLDEGTTPGGAAEHGGPDDESDGSAGHDSPGPSGS